MSNSTATEELRHLWQSPPTISDQFFNNAAYGNETTVVCPECGDYFVHIESVQVNQGGEVATVTCTETRVDKNGPKWGRGSRVRITYWCESGHTFSHVFQFHKGVVLADIDKHGDYSEPKSELWRD